mmetsp:Transcript_11858/g.25059  ORF Transcript_11858/g.25059 Transcript_11858/m.25059 type:complete len:257 (-) Transcript_11858:579-1349(-)
MWNCPPTLWERSYSVTVCPISAAVHAKAIPAGPAPTTPKRRRCSRGRTFDAAMALPPSPNSSSWQATGLTRQEAVFPTKAWSRQAWLHAIQVLMLRDRSFMAFNKKSGSARRGRAMLMRSETPSPSKTSAVSGALMRLVETMGGIGIIAPSLFCAKASSSERSFSVGAVKAPRGTFEAIVGTRDSCHPIPVFRSVTPANRSSLASCMVSSQDMPPSTSSQSDIRKTITKSFPRCFRTSLTSSRGNRDRFSNEVPPY